MPSGFVIRELTEAELAAIKIHGPNVLRGCRLCVARVTITFEFPYIAPFATMAQTSPWPREVDARLLLPAALRDISIADCAEVDVRLAAETNYALPEDCEGESAVPCTFAPTILSWNEAVVADKILSAAEACAAAWPPEHSDGGEGVKP